MVLVLEIIVELVAQANSTAVPTDNWVVSDNPVKIGLPDEQLTACSDVTADKYAGNPERKIACPLAKTQLGGATKLLHDKTDPTGRPSPVPVPPPPPPPVPGDAVSWSQIIFLTRSLKIWRYAPLPYIIARPAPSNTTGFVFWFTWLGSDQVGFKVEVFGI